VSSVQKGSAAAAAGVEPGDVILALNGEPVTGSPDLPPRVAALKPGTPAKLTIWRAGAKRELELKVGEAKDETVASAADSDHPSGRLGLAVRPLTPEEQRQLDLRGGAVVEDVSGPAQEAGIRPGDVVVALNGKAVTSVDELRKLAASAKGSIALLVQRGAERVFVPLDLG
jgi:serine protease Do